MNRRLFPHIAAHGFALGITLAALPLAAVLAIAAAAPLAIFITGMRAGK